VDLTITTFISNYVHSHRQTDHATLCVAIGCYSWMWCGQIQCRPNGTYAQWPAVQCYSGAIIAQAVWHHRLACAAEASCRPAIERYRPQQTTMTDARKQNNTGPLGVPVTSKA